jgi:hypothetical protein
MYTMDSVCPTKTEEKSLNNIDNDYSSKTSDNNVSGSDADDEDVIVNENSDKALHTKPLDVVFLPQAQEKKSNQQEGKTNPGKTALGSNKKHPRLDSVGSSGSSKDTNHEPDMARHDSLSEVLLSPFPSNTQADKRNRFFRAQSEPPTERTPLTSSSSENSEQSDSSKNMRYNSFNRAKSSDDAIMKRQESNETGNDDGESKMRNKFKNLASFATLTKWWKRNVDQKKNKREKVEERKMRLKLQYHFMSPFEKYKLGRKPWKLGVQILKILIVTTQVKIHFSVCL